MKYLITILFLISFKANATIFYVSNAGSDAANGTSTATSWQTIEKVNATSFNPGDQILFKKGDVWNERLKPGSSGSAGNVITFGIYNTGNKPLITALQTVTGLTDSSHVWSALIPNSVKQLNTVLVNGVLKAKGRYPNSTYLTLSSFSGSPVITSITGSLTGTPNYTGAEIAVRSTHFTFDVSKITSQSTGTLNFSPGLTYGDTYGGNGYFIQNTPKVLDQNGEWAYDSTLKKLYVYYDSASAPEVKISTIDTLVWLSGKSYLTFDGISLTGANKAGFQLDTANHITITNCIVNYNGAMGISALKSDYATITNDSLVNSFSNAIYMRQVDPYTPTVNTCNYAIVTNNYIKNAGYKQGMGMNHQCRYMGIYIVGDSSIITNNILDSIGYIAIIINGNDFLVKNNYITNFCFVLDDGGGIYTNIGSYFPADFIDGGRIISNIVINAIGAPAGVSTASFSAGIYCDNDARLITVDSNFVRNTVGAGILLNDNNSITVRYNTVVDSLAQCFDMDVPSATGMISKGNILYSQSTSFSVMQITSVGVTGTVDSNYYLRPILETDKFNRAGTLLDYSEWVAATGWDAHSLSTLTGVTSALPLIYYNPTQSDSTISLPGTFKDAKGIIYVNSILLQPFTSTILFTTVPYVIRGRTGLINVAYAL